MTVREKPATMPIRTEMAVGVACVVVLTTFVVIWRRRGRKTQMPGLKPSNKDRGNLQEIQKAGGFAPFLISQHGKLGPIFSFWLGEQHCVSVASPKLYREHSEKCDKPVVLFKQLKPFLTSVSIQYDTLEEGNHKRRRRHDSIYDRNAMSKYYTMLRRTTYDFLEKLGNVTPGAAFPLSEYMINVAIQAITKTSLGDYVNEDHVNILADGYYSCCDVLEQEFKGSPIKQGEEDGVLEENRSKMLQLLQECLNYRRQNPAPRSRSLLIDTLLESEDSDDLLCQNALAYIVGGIHTTGYLLTWTVYYLCTHPDVEQRMLKEIRDVTAGGPVNADNYEKLVYTRHVVDETMRCARLVPYIARWHPADIELAERYAIPAETPVIHALAVMLHNPELWPDPEKFDPSRFEWQSLPEYGFEPFAFSGTRQCPAYQFAYLEVIIALATILPRYQFRLADDAPVECDLSLISKPKDEIYVTLEPRDRPF